MTSLGFRHWPTVFFCWLVAGACAFAQTTNLTTEVTPLPDAAGSVVRVLGALALVLALFFGGVWGLKNWQRLVRFKGPSAKLSVLESRALDNRHSLYVVGYQRQRMLIGISQTDITLLSHLPDEEAPEAESPSDFATALNQAVTRKP